jgi:hypothetical protein
VHNLIDAVSQEIPRIRSLIDKERISLEDFKFMKYNGCEIIP